MDPATNTNNDKKQTGIGNTLRIVPPYTNEVDSFDNPDSYPDMELAITGMKRPLNLHRKILAGTSGQMKEMMDEREQRLEWPYDTNKEGEKEALVKALRFCYGESLCIGIRNKECFQLMVAFKRLKVTCLDNVITTITNFVVHEACRSVEMGVELLKGCIKYEECCGPNQSSLDKKLAVIVLSKDNMHDHYKEVVDDCLMTLPPEYLNAVEYGEPHTKYCEFYLKMQYIRVHSKEMSSDEKHDLITKCNLSMLNSLELKEPCLRELIDKDELLDTYEKALEYKERDNEQAMKKIWEMEMKMEIIEKEKDRMTHEMEEFKKRAERGEKEKEEYWSQMERIERLIKENCLS